MRKYQVTITINDYKDCRKIKTYADANNIYEALNAANLSILEKLAPGEARDEAIIEDGEKYGWKRLS